MEPGLATGEALCFINILYKIESPVASNVNEMIGGLFCRNSMYFLVSQFMLRFCLFVGSAMPV